MRLLSFAVGVLGKRVTAEGGLGGECVDLANLYIADCYGLPHVWSDAIDWHRVRLPGFTWVPNSATNHPDAGSLVVWGQNKQAGTGKNGHIAICMYAEVMYLLTLDQNWSIEACTFNLHTYSGVMGWHSPNP
jgi:hypothetical protein